MAFLGVKLPSDMLDEERFKALPSGDKQTYIESLLNKILRLNTNGITVSQIIGSICYFNKSTIWMHLENLVSTREAYKLEMGKTNVYYPNGKMVHPLLRDDIEIDGKTFLFFSVKNNFGDFIYLQERKKDRLGVASTCGGLIIPLKSAEEFLSQFKKAIKEAGDFAHKNESQ